MADETIDLAPSKRVWVIAIGFMLLALMAIVPQVLWKNWLCENPWFHSSLVDGPAFAAAIIAWFELRHSGEANEERRKANEFRDQANSLKEETNNLGRERNDFERQNITLREQLSSATQQIAENTKRPLTKAQRNAATLRKYLRKMVTVQARGSQSSLPYEIAEVSDDEIVTLFCPAGLIGTKAFYYRADCGDLSVDELPYGGCAVRITVDRYLGQAVGLGETKQWEDRHRAAGAPPSIEKGPIVWHASYRKGGSSETRTLHIYQSKDGSNRFQLEASPGGTFIGDNVQVSKQFMIHQVDYLAEKFERSGYGPGAPQGGYLLYVS